jgi:hypothetical protein
MLGDHRARGPPWPPQQSSPFESEERDRTGPTAIDSEGSRILPVPRSPGRSRCDNDPGRAPRSGFEAGPHDESRGGIHRDFVTTLTLALPARALLIVSTRLRVWVPSALNV